MATNSLPLEKTQEDDIKIGQVTPIAVAHFVHDTYTGFIAPLLPLLIEKLSLSLTAAGSLTAIMQLPAMLNPFIGYMADKVSVRYFVILAPGITATLISSMGFATSYYSLVLLLLATGISVAAFHAPAPAMIARVSGRRVGLGMSIFMASGELARAAGPLVAVWAVSAWTLEGIWRTMFFGWATSFILWLRLRDISARTEKPDSLRNLIPMVRILFIPLAIFLLFRNLLYVSLTTFLPTFLNSEGISLALAGISLSLLELAGVAGAMTSGPLSDKLGRKPILLAATVSASLFTFAYLNIDSRLAIPILLALGFSALSTTPVLLAMVQDQMPKNRAMGNGIFMALAFFLQSMSMLLVGYLGDRFGLRTTFTFSAIIALFSIPVIYFLPNKPGDDPYM